MQKKILALHDLSGFGRSSLVPVIASLSAAGHQCVPVPTAVFSTHMAIPGWVTRDLTDIMQGTVEQYSRLSLQFDAIYAGFLSSEQQVDCVRKAVKQLKASDGLTLIDPVMGDNGVIYKSCTPAMCARMRELCAVADLITPNTTEAAILLGFSPESEPESIEQVYSWVKKLYEKYGAQVVLTGLGFKEDEISIACFDGQNHVLLRHSRAAKYYPGTGDLFASVMLGALMNGESLKGACQFAGEFVKDCIVYTAGQGTESAYGVQFERLLGRISNQ